jgi:tryptophan halogenase
MSKQINKIVIIGGGSAGWMSATTMISQFPEKEIIVIESPNHPTVGVGESTIGGINDWMNLVGINRDDFIPHTDAIYKLSIRFVDFYKKGAGSFHYPFGLPNLDGNFAEKNDWYFKKFLMPETPLEDYSDCMYPNMALVNENKLFKNEDGRLPGFIFNRDTAFHFDAVKFAIWLRDHFCKPKGVKHIQAEVVDVTTNEDGVDYLTLENGDIVTADLFIDCTGFKSMLLGDALKVPFESYEDILPNNSAWAAQIPYKDKEKQMVSYTNCHAIENGWVWTTPVWSRIGTGYVYSDKYVTDEQALQEYKNHLESAGHSLEGLKFRNIKFRVGLHKEIWVKNVCAIGLSSGFLEPLESSGLYTTHEFLTRLVRTLGRDKEQGYVNQYDKNSFNFACVNQFKSFAYFVALHYALSHRDDTPYWRDVGSRVYSNDFASTGHVPMVDTMLYPAKGKFNDYFFNGNVSGLHCVLTGLNYFPTDEYSLRAYNYGNDYKEGWTAAMFNLERKKLAWKDAVKSCPSLIDYMKQNHYKETV